MKKEIFKSGLYYFLFTVIIAFIAQSGLQTEKSAYPDIRFSSEKRVADLMPGCTMGGKQSKPCDAMSAFQTF